MTTLRALPIARQNTDYQPRSWETQLSSIVHSTQDHLRGSIRATFTTYSNDVPEGKIKSNTIDPRLRVVTRPTVRQKMHLSVRPTACGMFLRCLPPLILSKNASIPPTLVGERVRERDVV